MSKMATTPVFACKRCKKPVYVTHLSTSVDDPKAEMLKAFMQGAASIALCKQCRAAYNWFASQGRSDEFLTNPGIVIYNVRDKSEVDYYGRKS